MVRGPMQVSRLLAAPLRRPARFLIPVLVASVAAAALARLWPPRYQATVLLRVESSDPGISIERTILDLERLEPLVEEDAARAATGVAPSERLYQLRGTLAVQPRGPELYAVEHVADDPQQAADFLERLALLLTREPVVVAPAPAGIADPLAEELAQAKRELEEKEASHGKTSRTEQELLASSRELLVLQKRYLALLNRKMSTRLAAPVEAAPRRVTFRVEEPARRPERPISLGGRRLSWGVVAFGVLAGWVLSLGGARHSERDLDADLETDGPGTPPAYGVEPETTELRPRGAPELPAPTASASVAPPDLLEPGSLFLRPALPVQPETSESPAAAGVPEATEVLAPGSVFLSPALSAAVARPAAEPEPETAAVPLPVDEIAPGSVVLRAPQPARAVSPSVPAPVSPEAPVPEEPAIVVRPGSVFWKTTPATATQPIPAPSYEEAAQPEPPAREAEAVPVTTTEPIAPPAPPAAPPAREVDTPPEPEALSPKPPEPVRTPGPAAIEEPPPASVTAPESAPPETTRRDAGNVPGLVVSGGPAHGSVLVFASAPVERLVGAAAYCHLRIDSVNVAPVHVRVAWDGLGMSLSDAGSSTGTYVNGRRIAGRYPLRDGDHISLGPAGSTDSLRLLVYLPPPSERAPAVEAGTRVETAGRAVPHLPPPAATAPAQALPSPGAAAELEREPSRRSRLGPAAAAVAIAMLAAGAFVGRRVFDRPAPVVADVTPSRVRAGRTIFIAGSGFDPARENNTVRLGDQAAPVLSAREDRLEIEVPRNVPFTLPAAVSVSVEVAGRRSTPGRLEIVAGPLVSRLEPPVARRGDLVTALGEQLAAEPVTVLVAGQTADVVRTEPHSLQFRVPDAVTLQEGGRLPVDVWAGGEQADRAFLVVGRLPIVTELVPPRGSAGERVTLRGFGFDPDPGRNHVMFGDKEALVLSSSPTELSVSAPAGGPLLARQSELPVTVQALGATSARTTFTMLGPPSGMFVPHFYAAPVPELPAGNHAFVATELGPVMLLTGPAGTSSPAERAAAIARVLNDLVEEAAKPMALTFEVEPNPSVALAGGQHVVATATPRDALGYEGLWARLGKPGQATPHTVATYWTALLRDHLALFVQRQRPTHVLALSPRGQVLLDVYAEARKATGSATGVPLQVFTRLWPGLATRVREMALLLPAPGESNPGAVIVGRWQGTMEEGGKGAQQVQARFFFEGKSLAGSMTRKSPRGVAAETRLRDVAYDDGALSFALPAGDSLLRFKANLREDVIAGAIHAGPQAGPTLGSFKLSYAE
jgi:hypothetical protein